MYAAFISFYDHILAKNKAHENVDSDPLFTLCQTDVFAILPFPGYIVYSWTPWANRPPITSHNANIYSNHIVYQIMVSLQPRASLPFSTWAIWKISLKANGKIDKRNHVL